MYVQRDVHTHTYTNIHKHTHTHTRTHTQTHTNTMGADESATIDWYNDLTYIVMDVRGGICKDSVQEL